MKKAMDYIDSAFAGIPETKDVYKFRKKFVDEVTQRANELTHAGLKDENVISDIIIDAHPDIKGELKAYCTKLRQKRHARALRRFNIFGTVFVTLIVLCVYFFVSASRHNWGTSWLIITTGLSAWLAYLLIQKSFALGRKKRFIYCAPARLMLAGAIMLISTAVFLLLIFVTPKAWFAFLAGVILVLAADAVFAGATKQKFAFLNYMLYLPIAAALAYVMLALSGVIVWNPGWVIIPAALLADMLAAFVLYMRNSGKDDEKEAVDIWQES